MEKRIMKSLDHPNIMKINACYEDSRYFCLVMDIMVEDVRNIVLKTEKPLPEKFARRLFKMMLRSVHHCHKNNIVHRDVKLENFLLDVSVDGMQRVYLRLTDFGINLI